MIICGLKDVFLAGRVGHDPKPYRKQLSELRYAGIKTDRAPSLLEVVRYVRHPKHPPHPPKKNRGDGVSDPDPDPKDPNRMFLVL
jgi:hypothetical protein